MSTFWITVTIILILEAFVLLGAFLLRDNYWSGRCLKCNRGKFELVHYFKANCVDEEGRSYADSYSLEQCDTCGYQVRRYRSGKIVEIKETSPT